MRPFVAFVALAALALTACDDGSTQEPADDTSATGDTASDTTAPDAPELDTSGDAVGDTAGPGTCPLSPDARAFAEQIITFAVRDTSWTLQNTHGLRERGYGLTPLGLDGQTSAGVAFLIEECTMAMQFEPYCQPFAETPGLDECGRMGCDGAMLGTAEIALVPAGGSIDARVPLEYDSLVPAGHLAWAENPYRNWRSDETTPERVVLTLELDHSPTFTSPDATETLDLAHTGSITAIRQGDALESIDVALTLPALVPGTSIALSYAETADHVVTGGLRLGETELARAVSNDHGPLLEWLPPCAP